MTVLLADVLLRYPGMTMCLILVFLLLREARSHLSVKLCVLLLITSIASSIHTSPEALKFPVPFHVAALFISVPAMGLQWWFARSLLEDNFRIGAFEWGVMIIASLFKLGWSLQGIGINPPAHSFRYWGTYVVSYLIMAHIFWIAASGLRHDLVENRRRFRLWFIAIFAVISSTRLAFEMVGYSGTIETLYSHATLLPILVLIFFWVVKLRPDFEAFLPSQNSKNKNVKVPVKYTQTYQQLIKIMEEDKAYTDHGLSITSLAARVGVPPHQLRNLINQTMGYRNFPSFLNYYRIGHAKSVLSDVTHIRLPILTIAIDSGFQTLSTFNRAFKSMVNETPSQFRKRHLNVQK